MRYIDLEIWSRREHFNVFSSWDNPHFNMCANIDLTSFYSYIKQHTISFNLAVVFTLTKTANAIPEFRYRIRNGRVIEHDIVHPSSTILGKDNVFSFCAMDYMEIFSDFAVNASEKIDRVKKRPRLIEENQDRDDWLFLTAIPWVSFTSFMHPMTFPVDSVPRFAWGKFYRENDFIKMPLSVQGHHAVMDGLHLGFYYQKLQDYLDHPKDVFEKQRDSDPNSP